VNLPPDDYLQGRELCRRYGTLSPSTRGNGLRPYRKLFAFEHWELEPDLVTVAKSLSGGTWPVGGRY